MEEENHKEGKGCSSRVCCCGKKVTACVLTPLGVLLAVAAAFFPQLYTDTVKKQLVLVKGSEAFKNWLSPPAPVYMKYYIFNYTNVEDIYKNAKPNVTQHGPYAYREIRLNEILEYNEHNITYLQNYSYVFDPDKSCSSCTENDTIYAPRLAALVIMRKLPVADPGWMERFGINSALSYENVNLFFKLTVRELLWGYVDPFLNDIGIFRPFLKTFHIDIPSSPIVALQLNGTKGAEAAGNLTVLTGKDNIDDVQRIVRWRGLDTAPYWLTKYGNMLNGTDGTKAPPFLSRKFKWYVFVTQLCRSLYFTYEKDVKFRGIDLYRFTTTAQLFANVSVNPDNKAFCSNNETCWGSGILCIAKCQEGDAPVFMSSPHFYNGDPKLVDRIEGMAPNETLHGTIADVEPNTGMTMRAYKRLQINVMAQKSSWLTIGKPLQYKYNFLPVMWIEEGAVIDAASAEKFRKMVMIPKAIMVDYGQYVVMAIGATMIAVALVLILKMLSYHRRKSAYKTGEVGIQRSISKDVADAEIKIRKIDSCVTIIQNEYTK